MSNYKVALLLLLFINYSLASVQIIEHFEHLIVGAGVSGIAASVVLTNSKIKHLMIEARDRIGGRTNSITVAGTPQDEGATFLHYPYDGNALNKFVADWSIGRIEAHWANEDLYYEGNRSICSNTDRSEAESVYQSLMDFIRKQIKNVMNRDAPLSTLINRFWNKNPSITGFVKDRVNEDLLEDAIDNGADLNTLSSWEYQGHDNYDRRDYTPVGGFHNLIKRIFNEKCSPELHLSEIVSKIDYSGSNIVVTTNKNTYTTKNLYLSFTLGQLKAGTVNFVPSLPKDKVNAINSIGFGIFQKLFVTFQNPFWSSDKSMVAFIGKDRDPKYPEAWIVPGTSKNMLIFFMGGSPAQQLASWSKEQIKADIQAELSKYLPSSVVVEDVYYTRWQSDPFSLGGFSYAKTGTTSNHFQTLKNVIRKGNNKIYLIGEHTSVNLYSYAHGAYNSGRSAASNAL